MQIVRCAQRGMTDTAIAQELGISEPTVNTYWGRIRSKFGAHGRTELVAKVLHAEAEIALGALRAQIEALAHDIGAKIQHASPSDVYFELLENAKVAIVLTNEHSLIESVNAEAAALFGYTREELKGQEIGLLIPSELREEHFESHLNYLKNPERKSMGDHINIRALHKDGSEFLIHAYLSSLPAENASLVMSVIVPVEQHTHATD